MIRILSSLFFLYLCILTSSCNQSENATVKFSPPEIQKDEEIVVEMNMMDLTSPPPSAGSNTESLKSNSPRTINQNRKLIKEGDITIESNEPQQVASVVKQQVQQLEGYISNESIEEYTIEYTLHIPAEHIDSFLDGVAKLKSGKVKSKNLYIRDITSRYVDTESRINSKKQQIEVFTKLLQQAKSVNDVLEVEKERARVQEDLESIVAQMNAMKQQLSYSEIRISIINTSLPINQDSFGEGIVNAMRDSITNIKEFIYALIRSWFWILLIIFGIIAYKKWKQRS